MKELINHLACSLASRPEEVQVSESVGDRGLTLELTVADEDLNQLIGKQGRTVKAMRSLLAAASAKSGWRYFLKIVSASGDRAAEADEQPENSSEPKFSAGEES